MQILAFTDSLKFRARTFLLEDGIVKFISNEEQLALMFRGFWRFYSKYLF